MQRNGFTLIELIVTLGLTGILITTAVPPLTSLWQKQTVISQIHILNKTLNKARRLAVISNEITVTCTLTAAMTCANELSNQMDVFIDKNQNRALDPGEARLQHIEIDPSLELKPRLSAGRAYITFNPTGTTNGTFGSLQLCQPNYNPENQRAIIITRTGRIRLSQDSNQDGVHETGSGPICQSS